MSHPSADEAEHGIELRKEAPTMALYVAICPLAALMALPEASHENLPVLNLVWGITIGVALAHDADWWRETVCGALDAALR